MTSSTAKEMHTQVNNALRNILGDFNEDCPLAEQGLDSMSAVRLQRELQEHTGIRLPLIHFTGDATSTRIAELLYDAHQHPRGTQSAESVAVDIPTNANMTPVQTMYWIGRQPDYALGGISTRFYMEHDIELPQASTDFISKLQEAWNEVIQRHGMLRATVTRDGEIEIKDDRCYHELPVNEAVDPMQVRERLAHRAPDLSSWPVHDIEITTISDSELRVHLGFEVILIDFPSIMRVLTDWGHALNGRALGQETITFSESLPQVRQSDLDYWAQRAPSLPSGPFKKDQISVVDTPQFQRHRATISAEQWQQFMSNATAHGASASGALLAAVGHGLRFAGARNSFGLGTTLFVPGGPEAPVGDFTRTGVVEVHSPSQTFAQAAAEATAELWQALDHSTVSSADIMRLRREAQNSTGNDLPEYPVIFTSAIGHSFAEAPWPGKMTWGVSQTPQVLIDMLHWEDAGDLVLAWDSVDAALPEKFVERAQELTVLAIQRLTDPAIWDEENILKDPWLRSVEPLQVSDLPALIDTPVAKQSAQTPQATAVVHGEHSVSYEELEAQTNKLAQSIAATAAKLNSLHADAPVIVIKQKSIEQVIAVNAVVRAGLTYIPVDPQWPLERVESVIKRSGAQMCVADAGVTVPESLVQIDPTEDGELREADPSDLAYVIFTSGSTGEPKGVAIEHRAARTTIDDINDRFAVGAQDVVLGLSALSFDLSVWDIFGALGAGATLVLPEESRLRDPSYWLQLCEEHAVTIWNSAPPLLEMLVDYAEIDPEAAKSALQHLRLVMLSGDWIPVTLPRRLKALAPQATVMSLGGATEASIWSICHRTEPEDEFGPSIPYGRALRAQYFRILDAEGAPVAVGQPGILHIGGDGVARGYFGDEQKTAERFITHYGERLYNTGDEGMWLPNGEIRFLGRIDRQVKINGFRIELGEVDAALARCSTVKSAVSAAPQDNSGKKRLIAHVVPADTETFEESSLREELGVHLPVYMIPSRFVIHKKLPVTDNGKVDHKALPNPWDKKVIEPPLQPQSVQPEKQPSKEATPTELGINSLEIVRLANRIEEATGTRPALATLLNQPWEQSLAMCDSENVTDMVTEETETSESALAEPVIAKDVLLSGLALGARYKMELPLGDEAIEEQFINVGTWIKQLRRTVSNTASMQVSPPTSSTLCTIDISAEHIKSDKGSSFESISTAPLTPLQVGYLVGRADLWLGEAVTPHYYTEVELAEVNIADLRKALAAVVAAHPALRLSIGADGQQRLSDSSIPTLEVRDLRQSANPEQVIQEIRAAAATGVVDPVDKPWLQLTLLQLPDNYRLLLSIDMLFCDVIGAGILIRDLISAYRGIVLEPETQTFLEYAQRLDAQQASLPNKDASAQPKAAMMLPWQPPTSGRFARERTVVSAEVAEGLRQCATKLGSTLDGLITTIVSTCAGAITGEAPQPIVATVLARPEGFENTIGEFTSTVRVQPSHGNFEQRARGATEVLLAATDRAHRCIPEPQSTGAQISPIVYSSGLNSHGDQSEVLAPLGRTILAQSWTSHVLMDVQVFWRNNGFALVVDHAVDALQPGSARVFMETIAAVMTYLANNPSVDRLDETLREILPTPTLKAVALQWDAFGVSSSKSHSSNTFAEEVASALSKLIDRPIKVNDYGSGFFDLGASSTDLMQLRNALVANGHDLTLLDVFAHPSANALGELLAGKSTHPNQKASAKDASSTAQRRGQQRRRIALAMNGAQ